MTFRKATRAGTKALIGLHGGSGSGKTYSALQLARGLVGPDGDIYMGDTESRRGEMYVGQPGIGDYMVQQLVAPYSSDSYAVMIKEAVDAATTSGKPTALVIDSFSHEWEGIGGVVSAAETIAESNAARYNNQWNGTVAFGDWKKPKQAHKHMMLAMLGAPIHIICCLRSQYKSHQVDKKDFEKHGIKSGGRSAVFRDEFQSPIQDANFIYEMTVHAELRTERPGVPIIGKCPEMLRHAFPQGDAISNNTGKAIAEWCSGAEEKGDTSPDVKDRPPKTGEALIVAAKSTAEGGVDQYKAWFEALTREQRDELHQAKEPDRDDFDKEKTAHDICKGIAERS